MKKCRRCGKSLPNNARVCSNCGLTFGKAQQTKKATPKQTARKPRSDSYDRYRKKKMQLEMQRKRRRRRMRTLVFWLIVIAVLGAVLGGMYANKSYKPAMKTSPESTPVETIQPEVVEETPEPTETSEPTKQPAKKETIEDKAQLYGCSIYEDTSYDFKCAYPTEFAEGTLKNNNTRVTLADQSGGAEMLINFEKVGKSDTAESLMNEYIQQIGVDPDTDNTEDNFFSVTFTRIGRIYHRKAVVIDNKYIYYDFIYDQGCDKKATYEKYMDFIDMYIEEANKTNNNKKS